MARGPKKEIELCPLCDWQEPAVEGRGKKSTKKQRWVVLIDKNNWTLALEREGSVPIGHKFSGNLNCFFGNIKMITGLDMLPVMHKVNDSLSNLLGRRMEIDASKSFDHNSKSMDDFYKTNLASDEIDPKIRSLVGIGQDDSDTE